MTTDLLIGIGIGIILTVVLISVFFPDAWGIWLAKRRNAPKWLLPLCAVGLVAFLIFFLGALQITLLPLQAWVWILLGVVIVVALVCFFIVRYYQHHPQP